MFSMLNKHLLCLTLFLPLTGVASAATVGYDTADGSVTVEGQRTFIIGTYHAGNVHTEPVPTLKTYQDLAAAGFNLVNASGTNLDFVHQAGMYAWTAVGTVDASTTAAQLTGRINALKAHPALAIYEQFDEPAWTWIGTPGTTPGAQRATAEQFKAGYDAIRAADPDKLVYTNHAPTNLVKTLQAYNTGTDIVATDIYPVNPGGLKFSFALFEDGHQGDYNDTYISQVGIYTDKMRQVAGKDRPVFMVLQGFAWEMLTPEPERREEKILYPTPAETRFMAWQAIIHGANGLIYWGNSFTPQPSDAWSGITATTREIRDLAPAILSSQGPAPTLDYHEIGHNVDRGIEVITREHEGKLYVFTCNADKHANKATLSGLGTWKKAVRLGEKGGEVPLVDGALTEEWKRFEVRLYELTN